MLHKIKLVYTCSPEHPLSALIAAACVWIVLIAGVLL